MNKINLLKITIIAFCCTVGSVYFVTAEFRQVSCLVYIILYVLFFTYLKEKGMVKTNKEVKILSTLFCTFIILGNDYLGKWMNPTAEYERIAIVCSIVGSGFIFNAILNSLYLVWNKYDERIKGKERENSFKCMCISFLSMWLIYMIYFLNQYPGSLSCDTPAQLGQAMGVAPFGNANPLINTLVLTACVQSGIRLWGNVNAGVAIYTVVQLTLAALIFSYAVSVIYKKGYHKLVVLASFGFWGLVPYNIVYATGMWKDTFFALSFLLVLTYTWSIMDKEEGSGIKECIVLVFFTTISALARNSGWSSLLVFALILVIYAIKYERKVLRIASSLILGIIINFLVIMCIYPLLGAREGSSVTAALSVPIQQIARVVSIDCELTQEQYDLIDKVIDVESVPELYDETISDPIKFSLDKAYLKANLKQYFQLWIDLGMEYPKCYLDAYVALTKNYWYPDASSWTWDTRIFDNEFGVERTPVIFKNFDMTNLFNMIYSFPKSSVIKGSSLILWYIIICLAYAVEKKNKIAQIMYVPILAIYAGLMLTSPVALFRYTYGATVCIPLLMCFPYMKDRKNELSEERDV